MSSDASNPKTISWVSILWYAPLAGYCVYRLGWVPPTTTTFVVFCWFGAIFGTLLAVAGLITKFFGSSTNVAQSLDRLEKKLYSDDRHVRRRVQDDEIRALSLSMHHYEERTAELLQAGYRLLGDYVDETVHAKITWSRAVMRVFLSPDGNTAAAVYDVRIRGFMRIFQIFGVISRDFRSIEFETEFSDGTFICTSNAVDAALATDTPGISRRFLDRRTSTTELMSTHEMHLASALTESPDRSPVSFSSADEVWAAQDRMQAMKTAFRRSGAFDRVAEVERVLGKPLDPETQAAIDDTHRQRVESAPRASSAKPPQD